MATGDKKRAVMTTDINNAGSDYPVMPLTTIDSAPDATHTGNLISSAGAAEGLATKADKTDLASIQATGTTNTTGATITAGTYFYLNGTLVRAITDIASGASFTLNTNYQVVAAGALNDLPGKANVIAGTTGASGITLATPSVLAILMATRGDSASTFALVYKYNSWFIAGDNHTGITIDASTGNLSILSYTKYKIIY